MTTVLPSAWQMISTLGTACVIVGAIVFFIWYGFFDEDEDDIGRKQ